MTEDIKEQKFKLMINCAEQYIMDNASDTLVAVRKIKNSKYSKPENCKKLLENYKPKYLDIGEIEFEGIMEQFCRVFQNYRGFTNAINYDSYTIYNEEGQKVSNLILEKVLKYYRTRNADIPDKKPQKETDESYLKLYQYFRKLGFKENKILKKAKNKNSESSKWENVENLQLYIESKNGEYMYNPAWYRYCRGIMSVYTKIKKEGGEENFKQYIIEKCNDFNNIEREEENFVDTIFAKIKDFCKDYIGIADTMTFDFFKELYFQYFIKDDIHIRECYKKLINKDELEEDVSKHFLKLCINYKKYTPYYIDKILWLCCTGKFYEDDITIHKMNSRAFLEKLENSIKGENNG